MFMTSLFYESFVLAVGIVDQAKGVGKNKVMDRDSVIATLRTLEPELRSCGVLSASVFGSVARGDSGPGSDVDVAVRLSEGFSMGGLDYFWRLEQLQERLSQLFDRKVDVVAEPAQKKRLQTEIDKDRAIAF